MASGVRVPPNQILDEAAIDSCNNVLPDRFSSRSKKNDTTLVQKHINEIKS